MKSKNIKKIAFTFISILSSFLLFSCSKPGDLTVQRAIKAYQDQNYDESLKLFLQADEEESNYSEELIFTFISNLYGVQGDIENSALYLEKALEKKPDYRGFVTLGMDYHVLGKDEKAEENYKKAIQMTPKKGEAYASLGALYLGQKKYSEAIENLKKATEFEPKLAVPHANLAVAYALAGRKEDSDAEFAIAEELKCENLDEFKLRAQKNDGGITSEK